MVEEATQYLEQAGLNVLRPKDELYYYKLRGSNELEHVKVLVMLGSPIPAPDDFFEEAQAFFLPSDVISDKPKRNREDVLTMSDGSEVPVKVRGYADQQLQRYYEQKTKAELYQAMHRVRPYLVEPNDEPNTQQDKGDNRNAIHPLSNNLR